MESQSDKSGKNNTTRAPSQRLKDTANELQSALEAWDSIHGGEMPTLMPVESLKSDHSPAPKGNVQETTERARVLLKELAELVNQFDE